MAKVIRWVSKRISTEKSLNFQFWSQWPRLVRALFVGDDFSEFTIVEASFDGVRHRGFAEVRLGLLGFVFLVTFAWEQWEHVAVQEDDEQV